MDALNLLKAQHAEVDELIEQIEESEDGEEKMELFTELADSLAAHATIEEELFYPAVKGEGTEELLLESAEEHLAMKRVLADMLALDAEDETFDAKLSVLKEQLQHHAHEEEEKELFPLVRKMMSKDDLETLGEEMEARFDELLEEDPRLQIPSQTASAAPIE